MNVELLLVRPLIASISILGQSSQYNDNLHSFLSSADIMLQLACMKPKSVIIVYDNGIAPRPSTHQPSHYGSWPCPKLSSLTARGCQREG